MAQIQTILLYFYYFFVGILILLFILWCFLVGGFSAIYIIFPSSELHTPFTYDRSKVCKFEKGWFEVSFSDTEKSKECFKK